MQPLNVVIYWHMHQPEYRDLRNGEYHQPWTYLHTIKDYVDMVAHLENHREARVVVNFAPVLLEQINDYRSQLEGYLNHGKALRDQLLAALADPVLSLDHDKRLQLIKSCTRANKERLIERHEAFKTLSEMAEVAIDNPEQLAYYSEQFISDLLVWYHLAWMAETVRISDVRVVSLLHKARHFSVHDRHQLVEVIYELIRGVIGRYRSLAEAGRIELSVTPYAHPIVPLMLDLKSAEEAMPGVSLPLASGYPGGRERASWHMLHGIKVFEHFFGFAPSGCWPSEGSVSGETVELISEMGLKWMASGETVLRNSLHRSETEEPACLHEPYQYRDTAATCFFRDDGLSDLIGFKYADWHADDAVANLNHHLEQIAEQCAHKPGAVVSIILDGENAWEYYPANGYYFLDALYEQLTNNSRLRLTTYSDYLSRHGERQPLSQIVAGSWVYGTFSTWIGEKDKNRAWDMLVEAKKVFDRVVGEGGLTSEQIDQLEMQLATCESSDWFWWFGEHNAADSVALFDEQYRLHLSNLYQMMQVEPPEYLSQPFSFGCGDSVRAGTMLPGQQI